MTFDASTRGMMRMKPEGGGEEDKRAKGAVGKK
jgi:hypothetical protein